MKTFLKALVLVPLALVITLFAVANRQTVAVQLDPLGWSDQNLTLAAPLFLVLLLALALGVVVGGGAVWLGQARYRRAARVHAREAARTRAELERVREEAPASRALPAVSAIH
ncbi:DUF1049 domain-containing protein [Alsobacter soli]|uniref:DUF1049 domain-containing protein n=1 Tax=Alsobacter soli TaxID=2109933 RepID=A0A2T1HQZ6_9HYPH|nr:lipopolysaccharide assembly protein LapA domain-containing protein [Alsobacter soli]PSC04078.1 DUF1049 domain-containing protein [Alsobacter soli]